MSSATQIAVMPSRKGMQTASKFSASSRSASATGAPFRSKFTMNAPATAAKAAPDTGHRHKHPPHYSTASTSTEAAEVASELARKKKSYAAPKMQLVAVHTNGKVCNCSACIAKRTGAAHVNCKCGACGGGGESASRAAPATAAPFKNSAVSADSSTSYTSFKTGGGMQKPFTGAKLNKGTELCAHNNCPHHAPIRS